MAKNRFKEKAKESCDTHGVFCREEISNQKNIGADEVSEAEQRVSRQQAGREDKLQSREESEVQTRPWLVWAKLKLSF